MKAEELKEQSESELRDLVDQLEDDLFRMRMKHFTGQLQATSDLKKKRRDIARVKTVLRQRQG